MARGTIGDGVGAIIPPEMGPGIIGVGAGNGNIAIGIATTMTETGMVGITTMTATMIIGNPVVRKDGHRRYASTAIPAAWRLKQREPMRVA